MIYLFVLNYFKNIKKIELTIVDKIMLFIVIYRTTMIVLSLICNFLSLFSPELEVLYMTGENDSNKTNNNNNKGNNTNRNVILSNDTWAGTIRSIFIYSSAALQIHVKRAGGGPFKKMAIGVGAVIADQTSKLLENCVNDPNYLKDYTSSIKMMWSNDSEGNISKDTVTIEIPKDKLEEMLNKSSSSNSNVTSFLPSDIQSEILTYMKGTFSSIIVLLKPKAVDYPVEDLMLQHHYIAIILLILAITILIFTIIILYNVLLILYKDKIMSFFKNKYILMYLNLQFKLLKIETIIVIFLTFYGFYYLLYGLHFLAVFPIDVNVNK